MGFMDKMQAAVKRETGWDLDPDELIDFLDNYADQSNKQLVAAIRKMTTGDRDGERVEVAAQLNEMEIVLAARRAWE